MFADLLAVGIETGAPILTGPALQGVWQRTHPMLSLTNLPTALFVVAHFGLVSVQAALILSQVYCVLILVVLGARLGLAAELAREVRVTPTEIRGCCN